MFPLTSSSGIPTRSLSRAFVAVLALLLSAVGGIRLGLDRLTGLEDEPALSAQLTDLNRSAARADTTVCLAQVRCAHREQADWGVPAGQDDLLSTANVPCAPSQRQGSAGGPRAP